MDLVELRQARTAPTPIATPVDPSSTPLTPPLRKLFMTIMGCVGWLVNTARPDVAYAHSRVAQHMANPTTSSLDAAKRIVRYLKGSAHYTLGVSLYEPDLTNRQLAASVFTAFTAKQLERSRAAPLVFGAAVGGMKLEVAVAVPRIKTLHGLTLRRHRLQLCSNAHQSAGD